MTVLDVRHTGRAQPHRSSRLRRRRSGWGLLAALATAGAIVAADLALHGDAMLLGLFVAVPFVAGAMSNAPWSLLSGVVALGAFVGLARHDGLWWRHDVEVTMGAIVAATLIATAAATMRGRRIRQLRDTRQVAEAVQQALLRPLPSSVGDVEIAGRYFSASRAAHVGGDLYDVAETPYGLRAIVGDVRGKGLGSVRLTAATIAAFREAAYEQPGLDDLARQLDRSVARQAEAEDFVTAVLVQIDPAGAQIVNCGHPVPQLVRDGAVLSVEPSTETLPLGLGAAPPAQRIDFGPGDRLLLYTDGVTEARRRGRFFDLAAALARVGDAEPARVVDELYRRLMKHTRRRLTDDIALLLLVRADGWTSDDARFLASAFDPPSQRPRS